MLGLCHVAGHPLQRSLWDWHIVRFRWTLIGPTGWVGLIESGKTFFPAFDWIAFCQCQITVEPTSPGEPGSLP